MDYTNQSVSGKYPETLFFMSKKNKMVVSMQGIKGAFHQEAAEEYFGQKSFNNINSTNYDTSK